MSKVQKLLMKQQLTAAVEEIFGLFERTIAEYEEEAARSKEEIDRQQKLLDAVRLHREALPAGLQQLLLIKEDVPAEQQEWSPNLDQEDPEPTYIIEDQEELWASQEGEQFQEDSEPPHIKEEQEELWTSYEGEQLSPAITKFPFTAVPVKSEYEEEKPQSSQFHQSHPEENREAEPLASSSTEQINREADGGDCGVSEPARNVYPAINLQPTRDGKTSASSDLETEEDSHDEWMETSDPQSGLDSQSNSEVLTNKDFYCSVCGKRFGRKAHLKTHMIIHTGEKPFICPVCHKSFNQNGHLKRHMIIHTGEKQFHCSVCGKGFYQKEHLKTHATIHSVFAPTSWSWSPSTNPTY